MNKGKEIEVGRLAFRVEGELWNAYWAPSQTSMKDAVLLGSIRMNAVERLPILKDRFMALMKDVFADAVKSTSGQTPRWNDPVPAPEHERAGRG